MEVKRDSLVDRVANEGGRVLRFPSSLVVLQLFSFSLIMNGTKMEQTLD